jgi:hypothetical protein
MSFQGFENDDLIVENLYPENPLGISYGGTGATNTLTAFANLSPTSITGDLILRGLLSDIRLPVGSDGTVLTSKSSDLNGVIWENPGTGSVKWNLIPAVSANMAVQNGYVPNNIAQVSLNLPTTAVFGDIIRIVGKGSGGFRITQNAGQVIVFGMLSTTLGITGYLESNDRRDSVIILCTDNNVEFTIIDSNGNLTVV